MSALQIESLGLSSLPPDSRICPICHDNFMTAPEWEHPVRIIISNSICRHIVGFRCLSQHINGGQAWSRSCPICRGLWIRPNNFSYDSDWSEGTGWEAESNRGTPTPSSNEEGHSDSGAEPPVVILLGTSILPRIHEDPGMFLFKMRLLFHSLRKTAWVHMKTIPWRNKLSISQVFRVGGG